VLGTPLTICGLRWAVLIFGSHMQIGCKTYSMVEWEAFCASDILKMGGREAAEFWSENKARLLAFRDLEAERQFAEQKQATEVEQNKDNERHLLT
jgi:hypothetical protein